MSRRDIELLAYRLWEQRGRPIGSSEADWFEAEAMYQRRERAKIYTPLSHSFPTPALGETTHVIFACDESAAKGKADQDEQFPGQVGVIAGLFVPAEVSALRGDFDAVGKKYAPADGKLHIADLPLVPNSRHSGRKCLISSASTESRASMKLYTLQDSTKPTTLSRPSSMRLRPPQSSSRVATEVRLASFMSPYSRDCTRN